MHAPALRRLIVTLALSLSLTPSSVSAQSTASLSGKIADDTAGVLPGVTVILVNLSTNQSQTVVSNAEGLYRLPGLTPGKYSLTAELPGFATFAQPEITLNVGAVVAINITMRVSGIAETVRVTGDAPIVETTKTAVSTVITNAQIEALPTNTRNFLDFALLTPLTVENRTTTSQGIGVNIGGARTKESSLLVDGFWNTDESFTFPKVQYSQDAIQEFQVVALGGGAEFGRAIGGVVNAVTKSGGNAFRGSGYGFFRDERLNAQTVLERARGVEKSEFSRQLYGGSFGGPLMRDRMFFFGAAERKDVTSPVDNNIRPENAAIIGLPPEDVGSLPATTTLNFAMGKLTRALGDNHTLTGTVAFSEDTSINSIFSAFSTRARGTSITSRDTAYQFSWKGIARNGRWLHELKAAYFPRYFIFEQPVEGGPPLASEGNLRASQAPSVNISGVASFGGGRVNNEQFTRPGQVIYASTVSKDKHALKFGVDVMYVNYYRYTYAGQNSGTYTFGSLPNFLVGRYTTYTQTFGDPYFRLPHLYAASYVQDSWSVRDRLTLNYGLRYDLEEQAKWKGQKFGEDRNNFSPRFAASYDLTGKAKTLVKFASGIYYDHLSQAPFPTLGSLKDNPDRVSTTWLFGQPGAPVYPQTFPELPPGAPRGVINASIVPDDMQIPMSAHLVGTLDHGLSDDLAVSASILYSRSWHKEMPFDRNLVFNDVTQQWTRPDPAFRAISQLSYSARAEYTGFVLEVRRRLREKFGFNANATFSRSFDMNDNFNIGPNDQRFPDREWGPTADVPTVRVIANGMYQINRMMQVSAIHRYRTGSAFDPRAGPTFDLNRDGQFNDRTPSFGRNSFRGPSTNSTDVRFGWTIPYRQHRVQLMAEAFNVFNMDGVREVYSIHGPDPSNPDPLFLTPLNYFPPREVQLAVRWTF